MALICEMTGVVLAGGESKRMGRDKAWLDYGGKPLVVHQLDKLARIFADVRISAKSSAAFSSLSHRVVEDESEIAAPIVGIAASLRALGRPIFALGVDVPEVPEVLIRHLSRRLLDEGLPCVAFRAAGRLQGLCAAYRPSVLPAFERNASAGKFSIFDLVGECGGVVEGEEVWGRLAGMGAFSNWNRPEDVR